MNKDIKNLSDSFLADFVPGTFQKTDINTNRNSVFNLNNSFLFPQETTNSNNGAETSAEKVNLYPDPDFIKMFVGQIPHTMDDAALTNMFSEFGKIYEVNVLRDKVTGRSKGCCFVSFFTRKAALDAQNALHNIKFLPGMHHPIQMKPADCENRNERKLFVGMLSKKYTEHDVRRLFSPYGIIEECTVLRDGGGHSRGCAFVTFTTRQSALNAAKSMHHYHSMEGCSSPLVVKFADTQKDKEYRRLQQIQSDLCNVLTPSNNLPPIGQQLGVGVDPLSCLAASHIQALQQLQNSLPNNNNQLSLLNNANWGAGRINQTNLQSLATAASLLASSSNPLSLQTLSSLSSAEAIVLNILYSHINGGLSSPLLHTPELFSQVANNYDQMALRQSWDAANPRTNRQIEGPDGANLFIYHLPQEVTDAKLAEIFLPFGNVISAKVFIDKDTNLSKCFGFVSFDNVLSALGAIQNLNGYQIGTKKLKVEIKRRKSGSPRPS